MMVTYRLLFILSIFLPITISAQSSLTPDSENVAGTQLAGDWQINGDLTDQLWPGFTSEIGITALSVTDNPSIVDMLPEEDCGSWIMNEFGPLVMAGEITFIFKEQGSVTFPYVLTSNHGNPTIVYWDLEHEDAGRLYLMIAKAEDKDKDILFLEFDFNGQPFSAWTRMEI